jgi:hypothetical protein
MWQAVARRMGRTAHEAGQAVIMVVALSMLLMTVGVMLVAQSIQTDPLIQSNTVQHAAYRGLEAGMNAYQSIINTNPDLANCNSSTNNTVAHPYPLCLGAQYQVWNLVSNTDAGNGTIPEWYLFDNPQPVFNSDGSLATLQVQIVGVAGFPNHYAYQSSVANLAPVNGFLTNLWWSDFESVDTSVSNPIYRGTGVGTRTVGTTRSSDVVTDSLAVAADLGRSIVGTGIPALTYIGTVTPGVGYLLSSSPTSQINVNATVTGTPTVTLGSTSVCLYNWANSYDGPNPSGGSNCGPVFFASSDIINGPLFSNDSIYISGAPNFGTSANPAVVKTHDPGCLFVDGSAPPNCTTNAGVSSSSSAFNLPAQTPPSDDSALETVASLPAPNNGCVYYGPTTITLTGTTMTVQSPDTVNTAAFIASGCPLNGSGNLPKNGVIYVDDADVTGSSTVAVGANPFDDTVDGGKYAQLCTSYSPVPNGGPSMPCYFGYTGSTTKDSEGDAFVSGNLAGSSSIAGELTIGTSNDIIIDGNLTYGDCSGKWTGTANESQCSYRTDGKNDSLGLIAGQYVEVSHPIFATANSIPRHSSYNLYDPLPSCGAGQLAAPPLCNPVDSSGNVTIDAAILALTQSFGINNYASGSTVGNCQASGSETNCLILFGSVQQEARGAVGLIGTSGFSKHYTWDPRLELVAPPSYLNPGTASYNLNSSAISPSLNCPALNNVYGVGGTQTCLAAAGAIPAP